MKVSDWAVKVCANFEGFSAKPYYCPAGVLTQGFGHTKAAGGAIIGRPPIWSRQFAERVLNEDLNTFGQGVLQLLNGKPIKQYQFDAFVCLAFNIGLGAFGNSTALRRFLAGRTPAEVAEAMKWWNKATVNGQKVELKGLVRRRNTEALMFQGIKDLDFDGVRDPGEPVYGQLPQGQIVEDIAPRPQVIPTPPDVEPVPDVKPAYTMPITEIIMWTCLAAAAIGSMVWLFTK